MRSAARRARRDRDELDPVGDRFQQAGQFIARHQVPGPVFGLQQEAALDAVPGNVHDVPARPLFGHQAKPLASDAVLQHAPFDRPVMNGADVLEQVRQRAALTRRFSAEVPSGRLNSPSTRRVGATGSFSRTTARSRSSPICQTRPTRWSANGLPATTASSSGRKASALARAGTSTRTATGAWAASAAPTGHQDLLPGPLPHLGHDLRAHRPSGLGPRTAADTGRGRRTPRIASGYRRAAPR